MTTTRDEMWADLLQFDTRLADRVWDGDLHDPEAPAWYGEVGALIRQARGPGEPHELVDEPVVVTSMRRVRLGRAVADPPRRNRARMLGRIVAVKAAAVATTAGMAGVAAAATTGIVAATVVGPAINDHIGPFIGRGFPSAVEVTDAPAGSDRGPGVTYRVSPEARPGVAEPAPPATGDEAEVATPMPAPATVALQPPATDTDVAVADPSQLPPTEGEQGDDTAPATGDVPAEPVPEPADEPVSPMIDTTDGPVHEAPADEAANPASPTDTGPPADTDTAPPTDTDVVPTDGPAAPAVPAVVPTDGPAAPTVPAVIDESGRRTGTGAGITAQHGNVRSHRPAPAADRVRPARGLGGLAGGHALCPLDDSQVTNPG